MSKKSSKSFFRKGVALPRMTGLSVAVGLASLTLAGCAKSVPDINTDDYSGLSDCVDKNAGFADMCRAAFLRKMAEQDVKAKLYSTPEECIEANPGQDLQCLNEWKEAKEASAKTAPTYSRQKDCESEYQSCERSGDTGFFVPMMTGYMLSNIVNDFSDRRRHQAATPVFTPAHSPSHRILPSGATLKKSSGSVQLKARDVVYKGQTITPTKARTISRSGFGSVSKAKSSWGSSRSSFRSFGG